MSPKNITLSLAVIVIALFVGMLTQPFSKTQPHTELLNKMEAAETFADEARAISLSMPLLDYKIIGLYADSLLSTLVHLNHDWVIFVTTQEGFEKYTDDIAELNESIDRLRIEFYMEKTMRDLRHNILELDQWKKKIDKKIEKYST